MNKNRRIKILIFCLILGINTGCQKQAGEEILELSEMQEILTEMHLIEAYSEKQAGSLFLRRDLREEMFDEILGKRNMSLETFTRSYEYYLEHPVELDTIYARMVKGLEAKLDSINEQDFRHESIENKERKTPKKPNGPIPKTIKNAQNR